MRPSPATTIAVHSIRISPPLTSPTTSCDPPHDCRWRPYSTAKDFEANAAMVLVLLLCAVLCALALNAAIRCFLRGGGGGGGGGSGQSTSSDHRLPETQQEKQQKKPTTNLVEMKLAKAEGECAICLTEFVEGENVQVLGICKHEFHAQCIQKWLCSQSSCPTCRCSCVQESELTS
ncbi:putative RING-H2 finger protein ATL79 [Quillaja saponaria]|uniref:RING-type E3 ubiquitin transferase n=1 Tax=Quillaja saponaria TaxID=32244 RepID=A0AAD7QIN8_QUISA|nr:putative RING-H2 finger protein ATL79 [Quillaja saponaria]